jgi:predicted helicase
VNKNDLSEFADALHAKCTLPGATSLEDQLKPLVASLIEAFGSASGLTVQSLTEAHLSQEEVRPDIAFYVNGLVCGYVELKAPGLGADAPRLTGKHNKAQWKKLQALPNLIYTDGREWSLYRTGERQGSLIRLSGDPVSEGSKAVDASSATELGTLLSDFLVWQPSVPHRPSELAKFLAPLTRFLRAEVLAAVKVPTSGIHALAAEWRSYLFPFADDGQFADSYAQTVTYAMLLARLSGAQDLDPNNAAQVLDSGNRLLARALEILGQAAARKELRVGFELLKRSLEALDPVKFGKGQPDLWLYFYEEFLAAYDPKLRRDYGVYYTPRQVVEFQVRAISDLLEARFHRKHGFADEGVVFLDPAVGTGTYPVAAIKHALAAVELKYGVGAVPARAQQMAENLYGFEVLVGPYAVAHLRVSQALEGVGASITDRLKIYLADTLESPNVTPPGGLSLTYRTLTDEHEAARKLKREGDILVCLGNPPYDRDQRSEEHDRKRKGGWVRYGDDALDSKQGTPPIFEDFLEPARKAGKGLNLQVIFNDYVYFWRWALWRLFEQQTSGGIVSFITASSYLTGPGFVGVREVMRRTFDELWVLDLGGDNLGARKTPNVFNIQTPVAIAIGVRGKTPNPDEPAKVWFAKIEGKSRQEKLDRLDGLSNLDSLEWLKCSDEWQAPLRPAGKGAYFDWPRASQLFPFHTAGAVFYRSWPISESKDVLSARWKELVGADAATKKALFKESRDRKVKHEVRDERLPGFNQPSVENATLKSIEPKPISYGFRALDRQYALYDFRLGDFIRPTLNYLASNKQTFLIIPDSLVTSTGPAALMTALLPDQHHFRGSFGGRDVIPLYKNPTGDECNVTNGLLEILAAEYGSQPTFEDLSLYVLAVLSGSYTTRFWNELEVPGPRVPLTKHFEHFKVAVALGRKLAWLETYGERFQTPENKEITAGAAKSVKPVSTQPAKYPEKFGYDPKTTHIKVGDGTFGPVETNVWEYQVSGLFVVQSWLSYRMKKRAGRKSSALDGRRPERWSPALTSEFLELLWVVEEIVALELKLVSNLEDIVGGACFTETELPVPTEEDQAVKVPLGKGGGLLKLMGEDPAEDANDEEEAQEPDE